MIRPKCYIIHPKRARLAAGFSIQDEPGVQVLSADPKAKRIALSIKALQASNILKVKYGPLAQSMEDKLNTLSTRFRTRKSRLAESSPSLARLIWWRALQRAAGSFSSPA